MNPYVSSGTEVAACLGRHQVIGRLRDRLIRDTPAHLSIIAPKQYGKTVLVTHLAEMMRQDGSGFCAVSLVDLRHSTPETDDDFRKLLAAEVQTALRPAAAHLADLLRDATDDVLGETLQMILASLGEEGHRMLILFDGFDYVPIGAGITANLLDQLRALAQLPSVFFGLTSRRPLRELCKNAASRSSDFWRIFGDPLRFGAFVHDDWEAIWQPIIDRGNAVDKSAMTELGSWSGGIPLLMASVLELVTDTIPPTATLTNAEIRAVCSRIEDERPDTIRDLWESCTAEHQQILIDATRRDVPADEVPGPMRSEIETLGFGTIEGGRVRFTSRCIEAYAKKCSSGLADLKRLFGTLEVYETHLPRILQLRLEQLKGVDEEIEKCIAYAIRDLSEDPRRTLDGARGITEAALNVIWQMEGLAGTESIPDAWRDVWITKQGQELPPWIDPLPVERGQQCGLVRTISGRTGKYFRVAEAVSKQTSALLDQVNDYGNFVNHRSGEPTRFGPAAAMCFAAIELLASLAIDLAQHDNEGGT